MSPRADGPSSDAWGATLTAPLLVSHQGLLLAFAREVGTPTSTLYFQALDPQVSSASADETAWNGWYRYSFPEAPPSQPAGTRWEGEQPARQLRLAGMDLLTVTPAATSVAPADASFQIISDGQYLVCLRPSARGTLYLNRLILQKWDETVRGTEQARYALESAWEVRYQRSGLRDVPLDDTDTQSYLDLTGAPFREPTIELAHVTGAAGGAFAVARVPTADPATVRWYVACGAADGVQLSYFTQTGASVADFTEPATDYPKLLPTLGGKPLPPVPQLAPALAFYAEQDQVSAASGETVEVQRAGRLLLAFAVNASAVGTGLDVATAVFDFGLDPYGLAPALRPEQQGVQLVDGTVVSGVFKPDLTSPAYPTPEQAQAVTHVVEGLVVTCLLLGQVQPHTDPNARMAEDGLVHLYYGGPNATEQDAVPGWRALVPGQPQALVAQFDPRVSRLVIPVPWAYAAATEQPPGAMRFVARQSGPVMTGATVAVSKTMLGTGESAQPQPDLCDVTVTYPAALGFGTETWHGVPRELLAFATVLDGDATDDPADPAVLAGSKPFYDFSGTRTLARIPLTPPAPPLVGFAPALTLVSDRVGVPLAEASLAPGRLTLAFQPRQGQKITQVWSGLPATVDGWAEILGGSAAPSTYSYATGDGSTPLFGLSTDAYQIDAPLLFHPTGTGPDLGKLTIEVTAAAGTALDVAFRGAGTDVTIRDVPADAGTFAKTLGNDHGFADLGLVIDVEGVAGNVLPTPEPAGALDLRGASALFDLIPPAADITGWSAPGGSYVAGVLGHKPASGPNVDPTQLAGFVCAPEAPDAGIPAYVQDKTAEARTVSTAHTVSRALRQATAGTPAQSGAWIRETPPLSCSFDGTNTVSVPVVTGPALLPSSLKLRPQPEWTFEAWVQPATSLARRLVTFHDGVTKLPPTAPQLDYRIDLQGQDVVSFSSYAKQPGQPDSSYFQTGTSANARFLRPGAFTWECWVQPQAQPAPPGGAVGGIIQINVPGQGTEAFSVTLTADRHVRLRVGHDDGSDPEILTSTAALPATTLAGLSAWTHVAVVGRQNGAGAPWTIELFLNGVRDSSFANVKLQYDQGGAYLIIGRNTLDDVSVFGKVCSLRLWSTARTRAEIRRTAFVGMLGTETGLLGCWPLTHIDSGGPTGSYVRNIATASGRDWDAPFYNFKQSVATVDDDYFLSLVASVAGLPAVEAHAVLPTDRWNHLAVIFTSGGALALNPVSRFDAGVFDWMQVSDGDLNPAAEFAVDAWVQLPAAPAQNATIISQWAWDQSPQDQSYSLAVDAGGNLVLTVKMIDNDQGDLKTDSVTSSGINLADGKVRHVAAVFTGHTATGQPGSTATYQMTLYADGKQIGSKPNGTVRATTIQLVTTQVPVLVGRTAVAPEGAIQPAESLGLYRGVLGRLRFWSATPATDDLFPELAEIRPRFGPPAGLAAEWAFRESEGVLASDSVGTNDGVLTSSAPWSTLRETSTLAFVANGAPVVSVLPATDPIPAAAASQFRLGAPAESGVPGLVGEVGQVSIWGVARTLEVIRDQQFTPRVGDEAGLLACWNFTGRGVDLTGGGNDANPLVDPARIRPTDEPVTSEGALVRNVYGGEITDYSACTVGRLAVGSFVDASGAGTRQARAVLKRQYVLDPNEAFIRPIEVGLLRLVYVGQVQTQPTLIGYIEGPPPVPSENLSRPFYLSPTGAAYTAYNGTAAVTLTQNSSDKIAYSSSTTTVTDVDFKAALGIFGIQYEENWQILLMNTSKYSLKSTVQAVASAKATFGDTTGQDLSGEWTAVQRDTVALKGDWEPYQANPARYLNPLVGRRFQPANLGYALVESLTADMYAMIFQSTGAAVGTIMVPNFAIPPDRNLLMFPIDASYTENGTLDGKVGLVNSPAWRSADVRRGSYFRPTQAYALAASIEAQNQRRQAYAAQFDWKGRGQRGEADLSGARAALPVDFRAQPDDNGVAAVPQTGIVNRYVWSANRGLHAEQQGFAGVSSRTYTGWRNQGGGGGLKASGEFFFYLGFAYSLDLLVTHMIDVHVGLKEDTQESVGLDVTLDVEGYLPRWDPDALPPYGGGSGAYTPGLCPGKVQQYRFMTFLLPASQANAQAFAGIVDPVWRQLSNDPTARAIRELDATNPVWRVLHRVTYVERVPPPIASRPVFSTADATTEPVNLEGNAGLLRLITARITGSRPTPAQVGTAVAAVINPAPTSPGTYPASVLEGSVPWWRAFLDSARPNSAGTIPNPAAAGLLTTLFTRVIEYVVAGYRTKVIGPIPSTTATDGDQS